MIQEHLSFWSTPLEIIYKKLETSEHGLSDQEAQKRFKQFGPNVLAKKKKRAAVVQFLSKFLNPLILILIIASILTALLGEVTNCIIILTIVLVSVLIDYYQESQAEDAAEKLNKQVSIAATVLRNGKQEEIPLSHVVPGDIVVLAAGDIIPADSRLLSANALMVSQSALTGESFPQEKNAEANVLESATVVDRVNCVFMGTNVVSGEGLALVVKTAGESEFGKVASKLTSIRPESDFAKGVRSFGFLLMKVTFILVIVVFFVNVFFKQDILDSFLFALALAIGLTPELLPMIITINLSRGALRMSKHGVIVKDLPAIENFGSMDILCTDKTGTLTEDRIQLERYENIKGDDDKEVLLFGFLNSHFQTGIKSPLERAILAHKETNIVGYSFVDEIPFDFERKHLSVIVARPHDNHAVLIAKGAPESLLHECTHYWFDDKVHRITSEMEKKIVSRFEWLSAQGFRVLAVGFKPVDKKKKYGVEDEKELIFLGLMAFLDPPKVSAKSALANLESVGIIVKILTGDNEIVTRKVCSELSLPVLGTMTGAEIAHLTEAELFHRVRITTIFARLNPDQKERIILALKRNGSVVGYMGDGINDAPSLRAADVGISVNNAVDVAKATADLILLHKDLHVLKEGVMEGRKTYGNIMKYIMMGTSSNFGNMFSVAGASFLLPFLPMLPVQILLNNLLYDLSQLSISSDNVDEDYLKSPKRWDISFIRHFMLIFGPISSAFDFLTFGILLFIFHATAGLFQTGWFLESLFSQIVIIFSIRTRKVPFFMSVSSTLLLINSIIIAIVGLMIPFTPLAHFFSFEHLPLLFYLLLPVIVALYIVAVESAKSWFYKRYQL